MCFADRIPSRSLVCVWLLLTIWVSAAWHGSNLYGLQADASPADVGDRPNFLIIYADDLGWRDLSYAAGSLRDQGMLGSDYFETPQLDRLATQSIVFTDAYSAAANCAPARASFLTGQYSPRHEIYNVGTRLRGNPALSRLLHVPGRASLKEGTLTWAQVLKDHGYRTGTIGKWHLSEDPREYGFDLNIGGGPGGSPPRGYFPPHPGAPGLEATEPDEYLTDRLTVEAERFIRQSNDRPWCLLLSHFAVHTPLQAKPSDLADAQARPPGELHRSAVMAAMLKSLDEGVGNLLQLLETLGLDQRTVVIFTSDNGGYGPATSMHPLRGYKGTYHEGGIRVPLMVRLPGTPPLPGSNKHQ